MALRVLANRTTLASLSRCYASSSATLSTPPLSPFGPRHLLSTADLTAAEIDSIVTRATCIKRIMKHGNTGNAGLGSHAHASLAMLFTKRSTRTRVSTEAAAAHLGVASMFLGADDIQLGVNETLHDTGRVIGSMVDAMVARVNAHADVVALSRASRSVVVNALSDMYHPLQALADLMTIREAWASSTSQSHKGLKVAWIGDANNVLHDLCITCAKSGIHVTIATPQGITVNEEILALARDEGDAEGVKIETTHDPTHAVQGADILVTDTWISMGEEAQRETKVKQFSGFRITNEMAQGANPEWKFMHCLPRHQEEVDDDVFYGPRSLVFEEAENRKWVMIATLEFLWAASKKV